MWNSLTKETSPAPANTSGIMDFLSDNKKYLLATGIGILGAFGVYKLFEQKEKRAVRKANHLKASALEPGTKICRDDVAQMVSSQIEAVSMYMDSMGTSGLKLTKKAQPISNKGVTCFLNSALQAFSSLPLMIDFLNTLEFPSHMQKEAAIIFELRACLIFLNSPEEGEDPLDTQPLIDSMIDKFPHLKDFFEIQQDTHEVILRLYEVVSDISEELAKLESEDRQQQEQVADNKEGAPKNEKPQESNTFYTPFSGKIGAIFTCAKCGYARNSSSRSFFDLAVNLPESGGSLKECIEASLRPEMISSVHCGYCWLEEIPNSPLVTDEMHKLLGEHLPTIKQMKDKDFDEFAEEVQKVLGNKLDVKILKSQISAKRAQEKKTKIQEYPDIFVVKVERAVYDHRGNVGKARGELEFHENLSLAPDVEYELCSVIEHLGATHRRGHYICAKRNFIGVDPFLSMSELADGPNYHFTNWTLVSDENSWNIEFARVQSLSGYILMFQRKKSHQPKPETATQ